MDIVEDMADGRERKDSFPYVAEFYDGKSVFMTGAAGFLGVVLLETLLELCPGIKSVYVLLREKKGVVPAKRKEEMFSRAVFDNLKREMPEVLEKVCVVTGDVAHPNLGMDEEDLQKVLDNASIVFHVAASVNFTKPLKYLLQQNVLGTQYVIDVCRKLKRLDAVVCTSTAYSNSNRPMSIRESIYRLPFPAQTFIDEIRQGTEESLAKLVSGVYQPPWPNFYAFSKNLTENFLQEQASDLPVVIIRPSIICCVWKRPVPGYLEDSSGLSAFCVGIGKGFIKIMRGNPENVIDLIPCDIAASTHLIAAWSIATGRSPPLHVIHCTSCLQMEIQAFCWGVVDIFKRNPFPKTFRTLTTITIVNNPVLYWAWSAYEHYIPAYMFDLFLKLSGSKIRLNRIYQFTEKAMQYLSYFLLNSWHFHRENYHSLLKQLQVEDVTKFELGETSGDLTGIVGDLPEGSPFYQWSTDKKSPSDRMKRAKWRYWMTNVSKLVFFVCLFSLLYLIFTVTYGLIN